MAKQKDTVRMTLKLHKAQLRLLQAEVALRQAITVADAWEQGRWIQVSLDLVVEAQAKLKSTIPEKS